MSFSQNATKIVNDKDTQDPVVELDDAGKVSTRPLSKIISTLYTEAFRPKGGCQNYTSLKLSKKLAEAGCDLKNGYYWHNVIGDKAKVSHKHETLAPLFPAYDILNDICYKYAKEFFGEQEEVEKISGKFQPR